MLRPVSGTVTEAVLYRQQTTTMARIGDNSDPGCLTLWLRQSIAAPASRWLDRGDSFCQPIGSLQWDQGVPKVCHGSQRHNKCPQVCLGCIPFRPIADYQAIIILSILKHYIRCKKITLWSHLVKIKKT